MSEPRFNLLDEPWVPVVLQDETATHLSLLALLEQSANVRGLKTDLPTQQFALLRVLLAFLHRALGPLSEDEWVEMWEAGRFPMDRINAYGEGVRDRFWLDHPTAPFMQQAKMESLRGIPASLGKIVSEMPDNRVLFSTRTEDSLRTMDWREAALWLIHVIAYDTAGIKTGMKGDPLVKKGKRYSDGPPAWVGRTGGIYLAGSDLFRTLMLNLTQARASHLETDPSDLPCWERDPKEKYWVERRPTGMVDLLTWQGRALRLVWDENGSEATGVFLTHGLIIPKENHYKRDPFTAWKYSEVQSKMCGHDIYFPKEHSHATLLWRSLDGVATTQLPRQGSQQTKERRAPAPGVLNWLNHLLIEEMVPPVEPIRLVMAGLHYDVKSTTVENSVTDSLTLPVAALQFDAPLACAVRDAAHSAERVAYLYGRLLIHLGIASGLPGNVAQKRKEEMRRVEQDGRLLASTLLDQPLRQWIATLREERQVGAALGQWQGTCRTIAHGLSREALAELGTAAWISSVRHEGEGEGQPAMTIAEAERRYWASIRQALPLAFTKATQKKEELNEA